jgi:hypothetical protein
MSEYELLDLVAAAIDGMYDSTTMFLSLASGYLLVAYLAGAKLTSAQSSIVSALFIVGALLQCWGLLTYETAVEEYLIAKADVAPLTSYQQSVLEGNAGTLIASAMAAGTIAALYFMWSVRHPKSEG